jgi:two-component system, NarL family, sensor histidine kinase UhpB
MAPVAVRQRVKGKGMEAGLRRDRSAARRDFALTAVAALAFAALSAHYEFFETIIQWTRPREAWQLDELPGVLLFVALGFAWYAWRREREVTAVLRARIEVEVRLQRALAENRKLAGAAVRAQEDERRHLARELHDELGQYVNAVKVDAVWLRDLGTQHSPQVRDTAASIVAMTAHLQIAVGDIVRRLRPPGLDELGLAAALEDCIDGWRRRLPDVAFDVAVAEDLGGLDEATNITLYRLVQEGLTNVARHARAAKVEIQVAQERKSPELPSEVVVSVRDDGIGDPHSAPRAGLGLVGMRERVEALAGRFELLSSQPHGFGFVARLPLRRAGSA